MARSGLTALPLELLAQICGYLCWHCWPEQSSATQFPSGNNQHDRVRDLLSLSHVSRLLHWTAEPFLYHSLHITRESGLYFFVRTLYNRPDLAVNVFEVKIRERARVPTTGRHSPNPFDGSCNSEPILDAVQSRLREAGLVPVQTVQSALAPQQVFDAQQRQATENAALISMLFQLVPNVRSLHLPLQSKGQYQIFIPPNDLCLTLPSLRTLALTSSVPGPPLDEATPILQLAPNLEILHCHGCASVTEQFSTLLRPTTVAEPSPLQKLTELALIDTHLTATSFGSLMSAVGPYLSKVAIHRTSKFPLPWEWDDSHIIEFNEVLTALQPWTENLKGLSFTLYGTSMPREAQHLRSVNMLRKFQSLEVLRVQVACLDFYGHVGPRQDALVSTIPNSICELSLVGYSNLTPALQALLESFRAGKFEKLCRIQIDDQGYEEFEPEGEAAQELREVGASFQSVGVDFVVLPGPEKPEIEEE